MLNSRLWMALVFLLAGAFVLRLAAGDDPGRILSSHPHKKEAGEL
jgi:hypothetical protein